MKSVSFPDGTRVHAAALAGRRSGTPDLGLYASGRAERRRTRLGALMNRLTGRAIHGDGTDWTQTNTLELKRPWLLRSLAPLVERNLRSSMRRAMAEAKAIMEAG